MPTRRSAALSEFHQSVHHAITKQSFMEKFHKLGKNADRHGLIKLLMEIEQVKNLKVDESYNGKDNLMAQRIYNTTRSLADDNGEHSVAVKIKYLTKALFAADSKSSIFLKILMERAQCWYRIGALLKCLKDCDYLIAVTSANSGGISDEILLNNEQRNECLMLKAKCAECLKNSGKMKQIKRRQRNSLGCVTLPRVDGKPNVKLKSCSDAVVLCYDKTRGRHLVATRNIKTGSVLIVDKPFAFSTDGHALTTNCLHCHVSLDLEDNVRIPCNNCQTVAYCSNACRQESWDKYHKYECTIFDYFYETNVRDLDLAEQQRSHLLLAWRTTISKAIDKTTNTLNKDFLRCQELKDNETSNNRDNYATIDPYDPLDYQTVLVLETHCAHASALTNLARSLRALFLTKCLLSVLSKFNSCTIETKELLLIAVGILRHIQAVDCNAYEIVENWRDEKTRIWEPRNIGGAVYSTVSLVNHGCYPNVVRHSYPEGKVVVRSLRFIRKGSEVLDCYGPHFVSDDCPSRRRYLLDKYYFLCVCEACTNDWQLPSDDSPIFYNCPTCGTSVPRNHQSRCPKCSKTIEAKKLESHLTKSVKKRIAAVAKMYEGNYTDALPILLDHAMIVEKIIASPSLEAVKTQQSIVQCYNSLASTCSPNL